MAHVYEKYEANDHYIVISMTVFDLNADALRKCEEQKEGISLRNEHGSS